MATIAKNFRVKNGLVVEGTVATVNGNDILTKDQADLDYITALVGGSADSTATPDTIVLRDGNGDFAANEITAASVVLNGSDLATTLSANDTAAQGYANDAETGAVATAAADATAKADAAEADAISSANSYTDDRETAITTAYEAYADQAEADAISTASADATSKANAAQSAAETTASADATSKANTAESNANTYTDNLIGDGTVDGTAGNTVKDRIDTAVANLVGGAPELLDTLDEIAAAIADDENFSTSVLSDIAQGLSDANAYTDTRETAITTAYQSYADTAEADAISTAAADATAKADAAEADAISTAAADATSKANTAESNANTYTDGEIATVNGTIDALTTDDIAEGTNEYYTTEKAQDAVADLIAAGTHANITITYDDVANSISFEAENGVADSTTDDLTEGSSNLYFTDQRAVDALQAVTPVFTEVDVNSLSKIVATTVDVATQNTTGVVSSFDSGTYTSAKFVVKADTGTHTEVTEVLLTLDSSLNIAITEYANVNTGGNLMDVTAVMNGTNVELQATVVNDNTTVRATGTLIA